jgi:cation:H+ antiporter
MLRRDGYIMLFCSFLLFLFILNFQISRLEALIFLLLYLAYTVFLFDKVKKHEDMYFKDFFFYFLFFEYLSDLKTAIEKGILKNRRKEELSESTKSESQETRERFEKKEEAEFENKIDTILAIEPLSESSLSEEIFKLTASGVAVIIGAKYFVEQAIFFALLLEVPETLIGISLVAVGTSIPELMVTISASRSGYEGIAVGNVIGSNITNILLILGCSGLIHPLTITELSVYYIAPFMLIISAAFLLFIRTSWRIKRSEGLILLLLYCGFIIAIFHLG